MVGVGMLYGYVDCIEGGMSLVNNWMEQTTLDFLRTGEALRGEIVPSLSDMRFTRLSPEIWELRIQE